MTKTLAILLIVVSALSAPAYAGQLEQNEQPQTQERQNSPKTKPDAAQARIDAGRTLWAEKKLDLAEAEFRKAIEENPESAQAHATLAGFLLMQNKTKEAIPAYQDAIILDPENPKLFAALSIAYLHQSKFNMAKAMADEALRLNPEMKQAGKLNEYIDAKLEVMEQAAKAPAEQPGKKPDDAMHNTVKQEAVTGNVDGSSAADNSSPAPSPH
jgi:tetratricopeptide (TPR) repeat protein